MRYQNKIQRVSVYVLINYNDVTGKKTFSGHFRCKLLSNLLFLDHFQLNGFFYLLKFLRHCFNLALIFCGINLLLFLMKRSSLMFQLAFRSIQHTLADTRTQVRQLLCLPASDAKVHEPAACHVEDAISIYLRKSVSKYDTSKNIKVSWCVIHITDVVTSTDI